MYSWISTPAVATNATTVQNTSTLIRIRSCGTGTSTTPAAEEKCYDVKDPKLTFVDREDEMDVYCVDYKSPRALMSCGHSATPMSLTSYCRQLLAMGKSRFECAVCKVCWSFQEVEKMALLTPQEVDEFMKQIWEHYKNELQVKSCPSCKSSVLRTDLNDLSVKCTFCSAGRVGSFIFCWQCLREWRGPAPRADRCDNEGCDTTLLDILRECPNIVFESPAFARITECPTVRACPTCGLLVEHDASGCKYITCEGCAVSFCFVCLKTEKKCSETSSPFEYCSDGVAPRQASIPARHDI